MFLPQPYTSLGLRKDAEDRRSAALLHIIDVLIRLKDRVSLLLEKIFLYCMNSCLMSLLIVPIHPIIPSFYHHNTINLTDEEERCICPSFNDCYGKRSELQRLRISCVLDRGNGEMWISIQRDGVISKAIRHS